MRRLLLGCLLTPVVAMAQVAGPMVTAPGFQAVSEPLHTIAMRAQTNAFETKPFRISRDHTLNKALTLREAQALVAPSITVTPPAAYLQTATYQPLTAPIGANFEALGVGTPGYAISGAPPDTTLAVSPTQIVQWVNSELAVYNKAGVPLLPSPGYLPGNALWAAMPVGSLCKDFNRGDPILQYDRLNGRWIMSQFAFNGTFTQNAQCVAVSQTNNALGAYNLYEYSFGNQLPDYGKMGLWPDALYITYNMFQNGSTFTGGRACAYDKAAMYAGSAATSICFNSPNDSSYLPSDLDGTTLPPPGTPNIHVSWNWYNIPTAPYTLQLTKFVPNFATPALSTFNDGFGGATFSKVNIVMDATTLAPCNEAPGNCVNQLGTTNRLDTLGDRHMYRLVYRNFGSYQSLLVTQTVDVTAGSNAQLRWWEIRQPAANPPVVFQNSTYIPDSTSRFMGSAAFDKLGNVGVGYSASSTSVYPAIRITGRLKNDPKNLLRTEALVIAGTGSQTGTLHRWGDYSTMQIDPADECTFWYTTQYIGANGTFNWRTKIASFKFPNCN